MGAAFTTAIHVALLFALLTFRPDFAEPADPAPPLVLDLVTTRPPVPPPLEPVPIEASARDSAALPARPGTAPDEAGRPAPETMRQEMDRTPTIAPAPSFASAPAPATGPGAGVEPGTGEAGDGSGHGGGGAGSGDGSGAIGRDGLEAPHWITRPTWDQMKLHDPVRAVVERVSGTAVVACRVDRHQRARNCRILSEAPRGYGFGKAALGVVRLGRINPAMRNGLPVYEAWVGIPVTFRNCSKRDPTCVDSLN